LKRLFCDKCGTQCEPLDVQLVVKSDHLKTGYPKDAVFATLRISVGLEGHPGGYGGPPELCLGCLSELVNRAYRAVVDASRA
jgi:hypothetical protein